jgi:hypothetical protein
LLIVFTFFLVLEDILNLSQFFFILSNLLIWNWYFFFSISFLNGFRGFEKNILSLGCCLIWHNRIQFYCLKQVKTLKIELYIKIKMQPFLFVLLYMRCLFWNISPYFFYPCFLRFWYFNSKLYLFYNSVQDFLKKRVSCWKCKGEKEKYVCFAHSSKIIIIIIVLVLIGFVWQ